jgi:hypothetical protein
VTYWIQEWLASLRFISCIQYLTRRLCDIDSEIQRQYEPRIDHRVEPLSNVVCYPEIKRSEASHSGNKSTLSGGSASDVE